MMPRVADLAAGFAVERRLVEDDEAALAGFSSSTSLPSLSERDHDALGGLGLVAEKLGRADALLAGRTRAVSVAASPEPAQAARASARWRSMAASKARVSTPMPRGFQRVLGQIEREAVRVVEREGDLARKAFWPRDELALSSSRMRQAALERLAEAASPRASASRRSAARRGSSSG